jgi:UDP-N-acetyl-D-mannosaminuronic acid dehydrogenase
MARLIIIGAGYVGLTLGVVAAESGHDVRLVEIDQSKLSLINSGKAHFYEPGIDGKIEKLMSFGFSAFQSIDLAIASLGETSSEGTSFVITLGTPLGEGNRVDFSAIDRVVSEISKHYKANDLLILRSTVSIGTSRRISRTFPMIGNIAFCPERTVEGNALNELWTLPQVIGSIGDAAERGARDIFKKFSPEIYFTDSVETAEAVKLISNAFRDLNFAFANVVALLGIDLGFSGREAIEVANRSYPRSKIPPPGPVGGPCLEKDSLILIGSAPFASYTRFIGEAREINRKLVDELASKWFSTFEKSPRGKILIFGLAFKGIPLTDDIRGSLAFDILKVALRHGASKSDFVGFDPLVRQFPGIDVIYPNIHAVDFKFEETSCVVVCTNHEEYDSASFRKFLVELKKPVLSLWSLPADLKSSLAINSLSLGGG